GECVAFDGLRAAGPEHGDAQRHSCGHADGAGHAGSRRRALRGRLAGRVVRRARQAGPGRGMNVPDTPGALSLRREFWIVWFLGALAMALIPVYLGGIGLSWDALNHHIYLGWVAEHPRLTQDFAAASYQAYQFPYLYWPAYRLAASGASGVTAGVVLALLQSLAIPPAWLVARA